MRGSWGGETKPRSDKAIVGRESPAFKKSEMELKPRGLVENSMVAIRAPRGIRKKRSGEKNVSSYSVGHREKIGSGRSRSQTVLRWRSGAREAASQKGVRAGGRNM